MTIPYTLHDAGPQDSYSPISPSVSDANRLPVLAAEIEAAHQAAYGAARTALEHAAKCGRLLIEAKAAVGHGGWLPWLKANTSVGARQSQKYMRLAANWVEIEGKCEPGSHLTLTAAVALLAEPKGEPDDSAQLDADIGAPQAEEPRAAHPANPYMDSVLDAEIERVQREDADLNVLAERLEEVSGDEGIKLAQHVIKRAKAQAVAAAEVRLRSERKLGELLTADPELAEALADVMPTEQPNKRERLQIDTVGQFLWLKMREIHPGIRLHPTGLDLPEDLTKEQWLAVGELLAPFAGAAS